MSNSRTNHSEPHHVSRFTFQPRFTFHKPAILSLILLAALYVAALISMPPEGLTQHDAGAKYLQVRNLRLAPNGLDWSINYPARPLDPELRFVPFRDRQHYIDGERIYLQWPIFLGLLTRIPWKVLGFWGLYVVPLLSGLGTLWAAYLLALKVGVSPRLAWTAIPLLGLATPVSIYSLLFFEHTLAALLVTLSLLSGFVAVRSGQPASRALWLNAALVAVAIYFRSELYVLALVMGLVYAYMVWRDRAWRRAFRQWVGAFAISLVPLWVFYAVTEGTILPLHAIWYFQGSDSSSSGGIELPAVRYIASAGWRVVPDFLFGPQSFPSSPRFPFWAEMLGLVGLALCALLAVAKLLRVRDGIDRWRLPALGLGLLLLAVPSLFAVLSGELYYNLHGFLLASPFVALALWPAGGDTTQTTREERQPLSPQSWLQIVTLLYVGLHALIISVLSGLGPISRHEWGQRYLLPAYPALVVLALLAITRMVEAYRGRSFALYRVVPVLATGLLALLGVLLSVRGYAATFTERTQVVAWQALAGTLPGREPIVTDVWWLPLNLAPVFYTRPIMLAEGDERLGEWARQMRERGVSNFALMTSDPVVFSGEWSRGVQGLRAESPPVEEQGIWLQRYSLEGR
ncbi:MAG: hypothetical protein QOH93_1262 [Chloroflexia bacterium]|jgi:hypothetical protein|nr:hypothetical protein [Chloroflexia bacterium]